MINIKYVWNDVLNLFRYERVHDEELLTLKKIKFYFLFQNVTFAQQYKKNGRASAVPPKEQSRVFSKSGTRKGKNFSGTIRFDVFILVLKFHTVSFDFLYCGFYYT